MSSRLFGCGVGSKVRRSAAIVLGCVLGATVIYVGILAGHGVSGAPGVSAASAAKVDWSALPASSAPLSLSSSIEDISVKMLDASLNYRTLSATYTSMHRGLASSWRTTIAVQQPNRFNVLSTDGKDSVSAICDGDESWIRLKSGDVEVIDNRGKGAPIRVPEDPRPDRIVAQVSGTDIPFVGGRTNSMLHPWSYVKGVFPKALVQTIGIEDVGGREGLVLEMGPNPERPQDWAQKWGSRRVIVVDTRTGIVLRDDQYDRDGKLESQDVFSDVVIDSPDFAADFALKLAPGEKLVYPDSKK